MPSKIMDNVTNFAEVICGASEVMDNVTNFAEVICGASKNLNKIQENGRKSAPIASVSRLPT
jgi:hypothetical protein